MSDAGQAAAPKAQPFFARSRLQQNNLEAGEFIERSANAQQSLADLFRFSAHADAKMLGGFEEASGNDAGFVFFEQELAERVGMACCELRKNDASGLRPDGDQILSRIEERFQESTISVEQLLRARRNL